MAQDVLHWRWQQRKVEQPLQALPVLVDTEKARAWPVHRLSRACCALVYGQQL